MAVTVFVDLQVQHALFRDVVRHHAVGCAAGCQLRQVVVFGSRGDVVGLQHIDQLGECRRDVYALFVFHALDALLQHFFDDHRQVFAGPEVLDFIQVHEHRDKGSLAIGGHERDDLILNGLHALFDFAAHPHFGHVIDLFFGEGHAGVFQFLADFPAGLVPAHLHEGCQVGQGDGLAAVLGAGHLGNDLRGHVAGSGEAVGFLNHGLGNDSAVLQHVFQIHQAAVVHVLGKIVGIVKVDDALFVGFHDILGKQEAAGDVLGHLAGHIVTLHAVDQGILVGVFLLHFLIVALQQAHDLLVCGVGLAHQCPLIAVGDVVFRNRKIPVGHDFPFHQVLDFLHAAGPFQRNTGFFDCPGNGKDLLVAHLFLRRGCVGLADSVYNFVYIELDFFAAAFDDVHGLKFLLLSYVWRRNG